MATQARHSLDSPEAYRDPQVLAAAKAVAAHQCAAFGLSESAMLERLTQGRYPKMVKAYLQACESRQVIMQQCRTMLIEGNWHDHQVDIDAETCEILIRGPYDAGLSAEVLKAGGHWCSANLKNRRCFVAPLENAEALLKGLQRWRLVYAANGQRIDAAKRAARSTSFHCSR